MVKRLMTLLGALALVIVTPGVAQAAAAYGTPAGTWSRTYYGSVAHIAGSKKPAIYVGWRIAVQGSSSKACVKTRGYRWSDGKAYWVNLGCGTSGGGTVHWGKDGGYGISAKTAVQVKTYYIGVGAPITFTD